MDFVSTIELREDEKSDRSVVDDGRDVDANDARRKDVEFCSDWFDRTDARVSSETLERTARNSSLSTVC